MKAGVFPESIEKWECELIPETRSSNNSEDGCLLIAIHSRSLHRSSL